MGALSAGGASIDGGEAAYSPLATLFVLDLLTIREFPDNWNIH